MPKTEEIVERLVKDTNYGEIKWIVDSINSCWTYRYEGGYLNLFPSGGLCINTDVGQVYTKDVFQLTNLVSSMFPLNPPTESEILQRVLDCLDKVNDQ